MFEEYLSISSTMYQLHMINVAESEMFQGLRLNDKTFLL